MVDRVMGAAAGAAAQLRGTSPRTLLLLAVALVATAVAVTIASVVATEVALRRRGALWALPTPSFEPGGEEVRRFAAALSGCRRPVRGALTRRAEAVRFRLTTDPDGRVCQYVEGTPRALALVEGAGMREVELRAAAPAAHRRRVDVDGRTVRLRRYRTELRLHRDASHALTALELDPDPLTPVVQTLGGLESWEWAEVTLDLQPLGPGAKRPLLRKAMRGEGKGVAGGWQRELTDAIGLRQTAAGKGVGWASAGDGGGLFSFGESTIARIEDRADDKARHSKLASPDPAFRAQLLITVAAGSRSRARDTSRALEASFVQYADRNRWRPTGVARLFGAQSLARRSHFDHRAHSGLFWPRATSVVVASEVAALLKPPTAHCEAAAAARSTGKIPPPPPRLPDYARGRGLLPLGVIRERGVERLVGQPLSDVPFDVFVGMTGAGKTVQALNRFLAAVDTPGVGACYFDPHADAVALARSYLLAHADRVQDLDMTRAQPRYPGLNLLSMAGCTEEHIGGKAGTFAGAVGAVANWDPARNNRSLNIATQSAAALCELNLVLPPELQATVFCLPPLLRDGRWREEILPYLGVQSRDFLTGGLATQTGGKEAVGPICAYIDNLRRSRPVAAIFGQPETTFDLRRAMDTGAVVLLCPPSSGDDPVKAHLVYALLLFELRRVAATRADMPPDRRRPFHCWADEAQVGDHGAGAALIQSILRECRKWGFAFHPLTQQPTGLTTETRTTLLTNSSMVCAGTLGHDDAAVVAREWGKAVTPEVLSGMPAFSYLAQVRQHRARTAPFLVRGLDVRELWGKPGSVEDVAALDRVVDTSMRRRPVQEVLDALDDHPARILHWLKHHRPQPQPSGTVRTPGPSRKRPRAAPQQPVLPGGDVPAPSGASPARERARRRWSAQ